MQFLRIKLVRRSFGFESSSQRQNAKRSNLYVHKYDIIPDNQISEVELEKIWSSVEAKSIFC